MMGVKDGRFDIGENVDRVIWETIVSQFAVSREKKLVVESVKEGEVINGNACIPLGLTHGQIAYRLRKAIKTLGYEDIMRVSEYTRWGSYICLKRKGDD